MDIDSLVLKGKVGCFSNWHETQSKFYVDTKSNKLIEAKCCTQEEDAWPSQPCQSAREGIEEIVVATVATEIGATSRRRRLSVGNIRPILGQILSSYPVLRSCTIHPE